MHHAVRLGLHHGTREQVAHVVVDVTRDAGPLRERGQAHLVVLGVQELAVLLDKGEAGGSEVVPGAEGVAAPQLGRPNAQAEPAAHNDPDSGEKNRTSVRHAARCAPGKRHEHSGGRGAHASPLPGAHAAQVVGSHAEKRCGLGQGAREGTDGKRRHEGHPASGELAEGRQGNRRQQCDHQAGTSRPARRRDERGQAGDEHHELVGQSLHGAILTARPDNNTHGRRSRRRRARPSASPTAKSVTAKSRTIPRLVPSSAASSGVSASACSTVATAWLTQYEGERRAAI